MENNYPRIRVSIADYKIAQGNVVLVSYALGSCVGIAMYDPERNIGGLAHILLPRRENEAQIDNPLKYAGTALELLKVDLLAHGVKEGGLKSKIAGGANMFNVAHNGTSKKSVGKRNLEAVYHILKTLEIPVVAEDVGGNHGRTVHFYPGDGRLITQSIRGGNKII